MCVVACSFCWISVVPILVSVPALVGTSAKVRAPVGGGERRALVITQYLWSQSNCFSVVVNQRVVFASHTMLRIARTHAPRKHFPQRKSSCKVKKSERSSERNVQREMAGASGFYILTMLPCKFAFPRSICTAWGQETGVMALNSQLVRACGGCA